MVLDSSTLKEIEDGIEVIKKDFLKEINITAAKNQPISSLREADKLYEMNRKLCVYRCLMEEAEEGQDKSRILRKINDVNKSVFNLIKRQEPADNLKIHFHE